MLSGKNDRYLPSLFFRVERSSLSCSRVTGRGDKIRVEHSRRSVLPTEVLEAARVRRIAGHCGSYTRKPAGTRTHRPNSQVIQTTLPPHSSELHLPPVSHWAETMTILTVRDQNQNPASCSALPAVFSRFEIAGTKPTLGERTSGWPSSWGLDEGDTNK